MVLFHNEEPWKKKSTESCFDVTMGSLDGAEICELVGLYILSILQERVNKSDNGLYRDDGLIILRKANGRTIDLCRKDIISIFKNIGFNIDIQTNLKIVDFLDVTFNLENGSYRPFKKPNDKLLYVHTSSNHPPQIIKQIPNSVCERLSKNSSSQEIFDTTKTEYEEALLKSGYSPKLSYTNNRSHNNKNTNKTRKRNIIWFNPPFSMNVKNNIGKIFLHLIDKHFPRSNKLHKIFNRNYVKVSYSCTPNFQQIIKRHNKKVTSTKDQKTLDCNCRKKQECPMLGNCRTESSLYKCVANSINIPPKTYFGTSEGEWKTRYYNHTKSFRNQHYSKETTLSGFLWSLKNKNAPAPELQWSIEKTVPAYSNISKRCLLCLHEKLAIITFEDQDNILNKRSELMNKCRHGNKFLLCNYKSKD